MTKVLTGLSWNPKTLTSNGCSIELKINGSNVVIPAQMLDSHLPPSVLGVANSIENPAGREPAIASLIVLWSEANQYFLSGNTQVTIDVLDGTSSLGSCTMWLCGDPVPLVFPSKWPDVQPAPVMLRFADSRYIARMSDVDRAYNLIMPTGVSTNSGGHLSTRNDYAYATTNSGTAYTVKEVVDDLFSKCCKPSGATTTMTWDSTSNTISGGTCIPVRFHAVNAWDALNDVLDYYMLAISHDIFSGQYYIYKPVYGGDQDGSDPTTAHKSHFAKLKTLLDAGETIYVGRGAESIYFPLPEKIAVYSPSPMDRGNETPSFRDISSLSVPVWRYEHTCDWTSNTEKFIDDTVITDSVAAIYDATPVELTTPRYSYASVVDGDFELGSGTPTAAETRAADFAEQFQWQLLASKRSGKVITNGPSTVPPFNDINTVRIRDYGDGLGLVTEFATVPETFPMIRLYKEQQPYFRRCMLDPDFSRPLELQDMDVMQVVQVWDDAEDVNVAVTSTTSYGDMGDIFPGRMLRPRGGGDKSTIPSETDFELCWVGISYAGDVANTDADEAYGIDLATARNGQVGLGRLVGKLDVANDVRPFYIIYQNMPQCALFIKFEAADDFTASDSTFDGFVIQAWSGVDPGAEIAPAVSETYPRIEINNIEDSRGSGSYLFSGTAGYTGIAVWDYVTDTYHVIQFRC